MADHGTVEYATAEGNDYPEHEGTYSFFTHVLYIAIIHVVNILIALTIGGVMGHWWTAGAIIVLASIVAARGLIAKTRLGSGIMLVISLLALALS